MRSNAILLICVAALAACGSKEPAEKPAAKATHAAKQNDDQQIASPTAHALPDACELLTEEDVRYATGWQNPVLKNESDDEEADSGCIFVDGADPRNLENYIAISVFAATESYANSAALAQSVGDGDGEFLEPANPIDDFSMPAIETRTDLRFSLRGITRRGVDLTVTSDSPKATRDLFIAALART